MRILIGALSIALLAGCATDPIPAEKASPVPSSRLHAFQQQPAGAATLIVTRDTGFVGGGCNTKVSIDGKLAAEIGPGESARFFVAPGDRMVSAAACGSGLKERETSIPAGGVKRFRISIDSAMSMDLSPTSF